ncbi:MAG: hypothetical protein CHACPFDD_00586 [Phycisphaerae bacterium]|nr:hypothetical protein [Phycisphaerae bacterium]
MSAPPELAGSAHAPQRAPHPAAARRGPLAATVAFYLLTRALAVVVAFATPQHRDGRGGDWWPANPFIRWDSGHYLQIMCRGYQPADASGRIGDATAFFPLAPLVSWPVWQAIRGVVALASGAAPPVDPVSDWTAHLALVLVSHVAGLLAVIVFHDWCRRLTDDTTALRASLLVCAFPGAMYFSTGYSEGVFVLCIALSLWLAARSRFVLSAIACAACTATRPTGVVLAVVLFLMNLLQAGSRPLHFRLLRAAFLGLLSVGGIMVHFGYLWQHYGRPDGYFAAQVSWEAKRLPPNAWRKAVFLQPVFKPALKTIEWIVRADVDKLADGRNWNHLLNLLLLGAAMAGLARPHPLPRPLLLVTILVFVMAWLPDPFAGGRMLGITRYHLMGLPTFLWLATRHWAGRRAAITAVITTLTLLQMIYVAGYVDWIMVS